MEDADSVEFDMPLQLEEHLMRDPQFDGMKRRFRISHAAMMKAVEAPDLTIPSEELYAEFFFDIWMALNVDAWRKKPVDGLVHLGPEDIR